MKKLSILLALTAVLTATPVYSINFAHAAPAKSNEAVNAAIAKIDAAAQTGDEQLVAKLLSEAIKNNPDNASQIIAAFTSSPSAKVINVASIVNNVINNLQQQKGSEALVAAVLSSYTPAAGGNTAANTPAQAPTNVAQNNNTPANLPPSLPSAGNTGAGNNTIPQENASQTSPR